MGYFNKIEDITPEQYDNTINFVDAIINYIDEGVENETLNIFIEGE